MADQTNPYTQLGMMGMMMPNPYTQYKGQLPIPGYMGTPTDAQGNPIASFTAAQAAHDAWQPPAQPAAAPGTTLNSSPLSPYDQRMQTMAAAGSPGSPGMQGMSGGPGTYAQDPAMQARINPGPTAYYGNNGANGFGNQYENGRQGLTPFAQASGFGTGQPAAAPAAAPTNPIDMRQAYLTALSNPGKVSTPGATVPQSAPLGQPSVLNSFLAANPGGGGAGAGNYNNAGFFNTLNKLRSA